MAEWDEFPLWVPFGKGHLAAVLTIPSGSPRGLVLLLPEGGGAPRSHRHRLWTRTARALAGRGLASVRFDYPHIGDSTGHARVEWDSPPVEEAMAVVEVGMAITAVRTFATVGNCLGAQTAFAMAPRLNSCRAMVIFVQGEAELLRNPGPPAVSEAERIFGWMLPVTRRLRNLVRGTSPRVFPSGSRLASEVEMVINSRSCLFLLLGSETRAQRFERLINSATSRASASQERVAMRRVPVGGNQGFRLPWHLQSMVIGDVVEWLDRTFPPASEVPSRAWTDLPSGDVR